jgi:hypothetical protein
MMAGVSQYLSEPVIVEAGGEEEEEGVIVVD